MPPMMPCRRFFLTAILTALLATGLTSCATQRHPRTAPDIQIPAPAEQVSKPDAKTEAQFNTNSSQDKYQTTTLTRIQQTGTLQSPSLTEVSGMSASLKTPGVLFALNDSGNSAAIYAFSEQGTHLGEWKIDAENRDWEDMSSIWLNGRPYLIIGDTGDNLKIHRYSTLHLVEEPEIGPGVNTTLSPESTLNFTFEDGPRNVEAFAAAGDSIFLISKEPVTAAGPTVSSLYELAMPTQFDTEPLVARKVDNLPKPPANFESKLAAAMAGVDLNHITAMDIDVTGNTAYLLTYRHVLRLQRKAGQSWGDTLSSQGKRIYSHNLDQAEALAVSPNRAVWITSEKRPAPLWAIPISPPL